MILLRRKFNQPKSGAGFTLIELLVVIAIIGLLAVVVLVSLSNTRSKGRDAKRLSDLHQTQVGLELYYHACGQYPTSLALATSNGCTSPTTLASYVAAIPVQGSAGCSSSVGNAPAGSSTTYGYTSATFGSSYTLQFCSENAIAGTPITASGNHTATPKGLAN